MRKSRFSYPASVSIGYAKNKKISGLIDGLKPLLVYNTKDIEKASKNNIIIIGKVGAKKKLEIIKQVGEKKLKILNVSGGINAVK